MTDETDPPLLETEGGALADALADAREDVLGEQELARVASALPFMTGGPAPAAAASKAIAAWKVGALSTVVLALVGATYWLATRPTTEPVGRAREAAVERAPVAAQPAERARTSDVASAVEAEQPAPPRKRAEPAVRRPRVTEPVTAEPPPPPLPPEVPTELELVSAARRSVSTDAAHALALTAEHARIYPDGILSEERDALRIRALIGVGRIADARRQADAFHRGYPHSVHWRGISALLGARGP